MIEQYKAEIQRGLMKVTTLGDAIDEYGDELIISGTGAIAKKGPGGDIRMIYDGPHGVLPNYGVRIRVQIRFPTSPDIKAVLSEIAEQGGPHLLLVYDFKKAHRGIPVLRSEWGRQACRVRSSARHAPAEEAEGS